MAWRPDCIRRNEQPSLLYFLVFHTLNLDLLVLAATQLYPNMSADVSFHVDPDGDLILLVEAKEILVSLKLLTLASPVFRRMLEGRFKEAGELKESQLTGSPFRLQLHETNFESMLLLCQLLHLQWVSQEVSLELIKKLAELVHFYDCSRAFQFISSALIEPLLYAGSIDTHHASVPVCYHLRCACAFAAVTKRLIFDETNPLSKVVSLTVIPESAKCKWCNLPELKYVYYGIAFDK